MNWTHNAVTESLARRATDEDGNTYEYLTGERATHVQATSDTGLVYVTEEVTPEDAERIVADAPDPLVDPRFGFYRKIYGSASWGVEDEMGMMDDEERSHFERR